MDDVDLHTLPPKNVFQRFVVFLTVGLAALTFSPSWLPQILVPRGNISVAAIIVIAGIVLYWICGYLPVWISRFLRYLLGIQRNFVPNRSNIIQTIIRIVCTLIFVFYTIGFMLGIVDMVAYLRQLGIVTAMGWLLWWTAGETPYGLKRLFAKPPLPWRAKLFFLSVIGTCVYGIYFLVQNPVHFFIPTQALSWDDLMSLVRCDVPLFDAC